MEQTTWALPGDCVMRTARKPWRCTCADDILGFRVRGTYDGGWTESTDRNARTEAEAVANSRIKVGNHATVAGTPYHTVEARPIVNPQASSRSADCRGDIAPGDQYIEYLGESMAWESGARYCLPCGLATWGGVA